METIPGETSERIAAAVARAGARIEHRDRVLGGAYMLDLSSLARLVGSTRGKTENVMLYAGDARWMRAMESRPIALGVRITAADALAIAGGTGSRTFRNLGADGMLVLGGGDRRLTLTVGERELWYKPNPIFNWHGPVTHARLDLVLWQTPGKTRSLELATTFGFEARQYDSSALSNNCPPDAPPAFECSAISARASS
jgi:hypothetical protein